MHEIDRLSDSTDWIDLDFVEQERPPERIIKVRIHYIWLAYHFEYQTVS